MFLAIWTFFERSVRGLNFRSPRLEHLPFITTQNIHSLSWC